MTTRVTLLFSSDQDPPQSLSPLGNIFRLAIDAPLGMLQCRNVVSLAWLSRRVQSDSKHVEAARFPHIRGLLQLFAAQIPPNGDLSSVAYALSESIPGETRMQNVLH